GSEPARVALRARVAARCRRHPLARDRGYDAARVDRVRAGAWLREDEVGVMRGTSALILVLAALMEPAAPAVQPAAPASMQSRARLAEIEIEGPLSEVVLDLGPAGSTRILGELVAGESRRLSVPLAPRSE